MLGDILELAELQWKLVWLSIGEAKRPVVYGMTAVACAIAFGFLLLVGLMLCGVHALHEYAGLSMTASYGIASGVAAAGLIIAAYLAGHLMNRAGEMVASTVAECEENCKWLRQSLFEDDEPADPHSADYEPIERNRSMYGLPPR
jgi:hypothetical protein